MNWRKLLDWRKLLIYTHRWSGIALTAVFMVWFVSGIVFMYVGMPTLPAEERLKRMAPLDLSRLALSPAEAADRVAMSPTRVRIAMYDGRPVYRLQEGSSWRMVFADTGTPLDDLNADEAMRLMRAFVPEHAGTMRHDGRLLDSDQWTLQSIIRTQMPLHRIALGDAAGTEYYVSAKSGEPVLQTTARGRFWGYLSAVLHWLYFTPLRRHADFWNASVVWSSLVGTAMCALGIGIGIWRLSTGQRYRLRGVPSATPYAGWMRWHHYSGLLFGFFACTWAFSGALSLGPFEWLRGSRPTDPQRYAATGGPIDLSPLTVDRIRAAAGVLESAVRVRELDFFQFQREPYFVAYAPPLQSEGPPWRNGDIAAATALYIDRAHAYVSVLRPDQGTFTGFPPDRMWEVAAAAMPQVPVEDAAWLHEYDAYYYSQDGTRPLPVLRIRYEDARRTWLYLDPSRGIIASRLERGSRWNRWLYHGLHSLDFPFLYYKRPLWDVVVIVLSLGGIALSVTSALPAWRRLRRHVRPTPLRSSTANRPPRPSLGAEGAAATTSGATVRRIS
jgi:hypothetical protein